MTPKEKLQAHSAEFTKELITITENVYFAVGYGASNVTIIEGEMSLIIVDTLESTGAAKQVLADVRKISKKPVRTIIYTHGHRDHVGGASIFAGGGMPTIIARPSDASQIGAPEVTEIGTVRARRQFALGEPAAVRINLGLGPGERPLDGFGAGFMPATQIIKRERETHVIDGLTLEFIAAPGETEDTMLIWLAEQQILISGDNYYKSFPNLYPIRGDRYRDVGQWVASLDKMITFNAVHLLPGHSRPLQGKKKIKTVLSDYRDGIQHILQATLEGMNKGLTIDQLVQTVTLPPHLVDNPYLQEFYGCIAWSVRAIFTGYLGWFDGNPTQIFPLPPREEATEMAALVGGVDQLLQKAEEAIARHKYQWGMQLTDHLLALDAHTPAATRLKIAAMEALAEEQINATARHYYFSYASELKRTLPL